MGKIFPVRSSFHPLHPLHRLQGFRLPSSVFPLTNNVRSSGTAPMPDARCPMPDARCPMPDARCPTA
ncbi:hypothetical protein [Microcoleus sp. CAWBG52]|uniref:hypothetical protein n=1 Tax=Microcoleus sp. CAWBG52 TaxID=2841649 RepID=UPI0025F3C4B8|nr:hypothetical protein [Microcoleus sp. CAWBG52]